MGAYYGRQNQSGNQGRIIGSFEETLSFVEEEREDSNPG